VVDRLVDHLLTTQARGIGGVSPSC
jgi:hypothetical protein